MDKTRRNYRLLLSTIGVPVAKGGAPQLPSPPPDLEIDPPFTLEFDITRNTLSSANNATFKIYNLSEDTRKKIYKDQYSTDLYKGIELKAGYGDTIPTIFKGNISRAMSSREGVNFVTTIEAYDGGFACVNGITNQEFPAGITYSVILNHITQLLPNVKTGVIGNFSSVTKRKTSLSGNSVDLLSQLSGDSFFIDLEKGYCLGNSEAIKGSIDVINSDAGLLGSPRLEQTMLMFDMIFEPRLLLGQEVLLETITQKNYAGFYKVVSIHHTGTISDAVCGNAITQVGLWYGQQQLKIVGTA